MTAILDRTGLAPVHGMKVRGIDHADTTAIVGYVADDRWVAQQKFDGTRALVWIDGTDRRLLAHNGETLRHTAATQWAASLLARFDDADGAYQVDGELLVDTGTYVVYDVLVYDGEPVWTLRYADRRALLEGMAGRFGDGVVVADEAAGQAAKTRLVVQSSKLMFEGVIFKDVDAAYEPGARTVTQLKLKHYRECDAVVTERNTGTSLNARLAVYADGRLRPVGGCSMIGKPDAQVGDVVEIKYLYATESLTLYQPTLLRIRDDKTAVECSIDQLAPARKGILDVG